MDEGFRLFDFFSAAKKSAKPKIFTIPPTVSFLDSVASSVLNRDIKTPIELTKTTLLLPTRRACRAVREAFLKMSGGHATLLPKIRPIGELDEELSLLSMDSHIFGYDMKSLEVPPAIGDIERRLVLTKLVMKWVEAMRASELADPESLDAIIPPTSPAQASMLANELGKLINETETERVDLAGLREIVPDNFSQHWELTLKFLTIVTETLPLYLEERGLISPVERRNLLLSREAERLKRNPPEHKIIAAGVTGSIPAAADLLKVILGLPQGEVILPGLDMELDEESWDAIAPDHPEHPQYGMKKLLDHMEVSRSDIAYLPGMEPNKVTKVKLSLISETMRPAETTHNWQGFLRRSDAKASLQSALEDCALITAPSAQDEAEVVSLILRHAVETPGKTAALVTPDRILGRRVSVQLLKWGLMVDDSAGRPLAKTVPGNFMDLIVAAISKQFSAPQLMALLKHPLTRLGIEAGKIRAAARSLEIIALRQPLAGAGLGPMRKTLSRTRAEFEAGDKKHGVMRRMTERDWDRAEDLLDRIETAFLPMTQLADQEEGTLQQFAEAHVKVAETLATDHEGVSDSLWAGEAGETLSVFLASMLDEELDSPALSLEDYPEFYRSLLAGQSMRPQTPVHPRLFIWGPLEARLQRPDIVVLGGLNEGTWPQATETDAWLSRPMRQSLGLPAPEQRTGFFAHDFSQMLGAEKVYLTRAAKVDGVPTVPSRWLLRLETLLGGFGFNKLLETKPEEPWLAWARSRDKIEQRSSVSAPAPCPPVGKRPRQLSVTRIEDWIANPYVIFAKEILNLVPLPDLGCEPDNALRGQVIHQALHMFTQTYGTDLPQDADDKLVDIAKQILVHYAAHPSVAAFWTPRFIRFAEWFCQTEPARQQGVGKILTETKGLLKIDMPFGPFTLTARADRLDVCEDGSVRVYDYKSGGFPNDRDVVRLKSPQLPLEAAIILHNGFAGIRSSDISKLAYISASGGEPAGLENVVKHDDIPGLAQDALLRLKALIAKFDKPDTPYAALRRQQFDYRYDDYAHLARVKEWSLGDLKAGGDE